MLKDSARARLPRHFYARPAPAVARDLLGRRLVRLVEGQRVAGRIIEVEAYTGADDAASHAFRGRTARNAPMFGPPGHAYVYFIYGMHWMFNVVAHEVRPDAPPGAVLVRALVPEEGLALMRRWRGRADRLTNGPGRLTQALRIDGALNGADLLGDEIFIEGGTPVGEEQVAQGPRVGVRGDALALTRPWRFWVRDPHT